MESGAKCCDEEIFEIEDFTIVTIKEGLCAELEQLLRKWELSGDNGNKYSFTKAALAECQWDSKYDNIRYGGRHLIATHYWPKNLQKIEEVNKSNVFDEVHTSDSFLSNAAQLFRSSETDFCPGSVICNQFGVLEFILLTPSDWNLDRVSNEDQLRGLLSVITESAGKAGCALPIFVQYGERERQLYFGVCQNNSMRTNFESVHQRRGHPLRCHLSGCLDIFRETLQSSLMDEGDLRISMQFDYVFQDKPCYTFLPKKMVVEEEFIPAEDASIIDISHLPFGAATDVIEELGLSAVWLNIERGIAVEEQNLTNLDPQRALAWSAWVSMQRNASYLMSSCLKKLLETAQSQEGSKLVVEHSRQGASRALSALLSPAGPKNFSIGSTDQVISGDDSESDVIRYWIDKVFGKTKRGHVFPTCNTSCTVDVESVRPKKTASSPGPGSAVKSDQCSKACPAKGIMKNGQTMNIYEELNILCARNHSSVEFSRLWSAITCELQECYENNFCVPGFCRMDECVAPDLSTCKFHQNLQLLQCAIQAKKRCESKDLFMQKWPPHKSEEDEFFDAQESLLEENDNEKPDPLGAEGRLKPFGALRLFHFPDRIMYEPVTQSRVPVTEDMLERYNEYLASLMDPEERIKAQLEPLFSDMEAFKAANPGCCFEDFVRWHSPRDFIVDDEDTGKGCLSSRMTGEDNTWQQTWNQAQPKPVRRQKMLFDHLKAANKVSNCTRSNDLGDYLDVIGDIAQIEGVIACCNVLYTQLTSAADKKLTDDEKDEIRQFAMMLVQSNEQNCENVVNGGKAGAGYRVPIVQGLSGTVGSAMKSLFFSSIKNHSNRTEKRTLEQILTGDEDMPYRRRQYIMRCSARRPTLGSRTLPQRLYASISKEEYRVCLTLSSDTVLS